MVEGARLESVFRGNSNVGSNPTLSAIQSRYFSIFRERCTCWPYSPAKAQDFYSKRDWRAFSALCITIRVAVILC